MEEGKECAREIVHTCICWFTSQMNASVRARAGQSQEPRPSFRSPTWVAGTQVLGLSFTGFPGTLAGSWVGKEHLGLKLVLIWKADIAGSGWTFCYSTMLNPFPFCCWIIYHYMKYAMLSLTKHQLMEFELFPFLAIMNNAAMNIHIWIIVWTCIFSWGYT